MRHFSVPKILQEIMGQSYEKPDIWSPYIYMDDSSSSQKV